MLSINDATISAISAYSNVIRFIEFNAIQYNRFKAELKALKPVLLAVAGFITETVEGAFELVYESIMAVEFAVTEIPEFEDQLFFYVGEYDVTSDEVMPLLDESDYAQANEAYTAPLVAFVHMLTESFCKETAIECSEIGVVAHQISTMSLIEMRKFALAIGLKFNGNLGASKLSALLCQHYQVA